MPKNVWLATMLFAFVTHVYAEIKITYLPEKDGQWAVYYTGPQSFTLTFSYLLA